MRQMISLLFTGLCLAAPAMAGGPIVKISFFTPPAVDNDPVLNTLDPESLHVWLLTIRGDDRGGLTFAQYQQHGETRTDGWTRGMRLRLRTDALPLAFDFAWTRGRRSSTTISSGADHPITIYYDRCPYAANTGCYTTFNGSIDLQKNRHFADLHTFRGGFTYDILDASRRLSLEPGIGIETSVARHTRRVYHIRSSVNRPDPEVVQDQTEKTWNGSNRYGLYLSLDAEIYPFGKHGPGIGFGTRYLPNPPEWSLASGSLAGEYSIPFQHRRWSHMVSATLAF